MKQIELTMGVEYTDMVTGARFKAGQSYDVSDEDAKRLMRPDMYGRMYFKMAGGKDPNVPDPADEYEEEVVSAPTSKGGKRSNITIRRPKKKVAAEADTEGGEIDTAEDQIPIE